MMLSMRSRIGTLLLAVLCGLILAGGANALLDTPEIIIQQNEELARNMIPRGFKRGNPRAPKFLEVLKVYDRSLPAKWKGKMQVCECGIKKEEDREIYWAQIGHKKKDEFIAIVVLLINLVCVVLQVSRSLRYATRD